MTEQQPSPRPPVAGHAYPPPPPRPTARPARTAYGQRTFHWLLATILGIHTALAFLQSVLAGSYMSGSLDAMALHGAIGSGLTAMVMIQALACLLFWFPGRGPWWPLLASILLFFVEGFQVGMGYARALGVHVPLGVALILVITGMFVWSLRWRPKRLRETTR